MEKLKENETDRQVVYNFKVERMYDDELFTFLKRFKHISSIHYDDQLIAIIKHTTDKMWCIVVSFQTAKEVQEFQNMLILDFLHSENEKG